MSWNELDEDEEDDDASPHGAQGPDEEDQSDEPAEVTCSYCRREIPEDVLQCPFCGSYLSHEDAPQHRTWIWYVAFGLLLALLFVYLFRR